MATELLNASTCRAVATHSFEMNKKLQRGKSVPDGFVPPASLITLDWDAHHERQQKASETSKRLDDIRSQRRPSMVMLQSEEYIEAHLFDDLNLVENDSQEMHSTPGYVGEDSIPQVHDSVDSARASPLSKHAAKYPRSSQNGGAAANAYRTRRASLGVPIDQQGNYDEFAHLLRLMREGQQQVAQAGGTGYRPVTRRTSKPQHACLSPPSMSAFVKRTSHGGGAADTISGSGVIRDLLSPTSPNAHPRRASASGADGAVPQALPSVSSATGVQQRHTRSDKDMTKRDLGNGHSPTSSAPSSPVPPARTRRASLSGGSLTNQPTSPPPSSSSRPQRASLSGGLESTPASLPVVHNYNGGGSSGGGASAPVALRSILKHTTAPTLPTILCEDTRPSHGRRAATRTSGQPLDGHDLLGHCGGGSSAMHSHESLHQASERTSNSSASSSTLGRISGDGRSGDGLSARHQTERTSPSRHPLMTTFGMKAPSSPPVPATGTTMTATTMAPIGSHSNAATAADTGAAPDGAATTASAGAAATFASRGAPHDSFRFHPGSLRLMGDDGAIMGGVMAGGTASGTVSGGAGSLPVASPQPAAVDLGEAAAGASAGATPHVSTSHVGVHMGGTGGTKEGSAASGAASAAPHAAHARLGGARKSASGGVAGWLDKVKGLWKPTRQATV